jgi:hypothetical protein
MEAYTRISLPVIKLNVSSPEGDDNKGTKFKQERSKWSEILPQPKDVHK